MDQQQQPATAAPATAPLRVRIDFEHGKCPRCGGSGRYASSAWEGRCLSCNGSGAKLTRAGKASRTLWDALVAANLQVSPADLVAGQRIHYAGRVRQVVSVKPDPARDGWFVQTVGLGIGFTGTSTCQRMATSAEIRAVAGTLGRGATLVEF